MKYHIHIYKVVGKIELNIEAKNSEEAKAEALMKTNRDKFLKPDCNRIAIDFKIQMKKPNNWLTIHDVQNYVKSFDRHWSRTHISNLIKSKKLKSFKMSASRFFLKKDIEKYLKTLKRKAPKINYEIS